VILESKIEMVASNEVELDDENRETVENLIEKLEDDDDIQNIYTNLK
jgi:transcriptional/translational regulatory protein YebC/TACO1